jgi:hydrogenase maturation protein HypF
LPREKTPARILGRWPGRQRRRALGEFFGTGDGGEFESSTRYPMRAGMNFLTKTPLDRLVGTEKGKSERSRRHIFLSGVVQGVGFRPFVYSAARRYRLGGWVRNSSQGVHLEVEGEKKSIEGFTHEVTRQAPPRARIESWQVEELAPVGERNFAIRESVEEPGQYQLVSPDIATCPDCRREIFDPTDRRHFYPFTNCTNCGPRFTIIREIPYDRPRTTMDRFRMCPLCRQEYENPADRRFHAQPNACPRCGPRLQLVDRQGKTLDCPDPIDSALQLLQDGKILAIKGLGGFLLACDAANAAAVQTLRRRKHRPDKPLAVMMPHLEAVRAHCQLSAEEEKLLLTPASPIVLLRWKKGSTIVREVAPGQTYLGVLLPYTPLHHLLFRKSPMPLVMTSGNRSEEPIARENDEALTRLAPIADAFLLHDREIHVQYDDSVAAVVHDRPVLLRRARGYAPFPVHLSFPVRPLLACGGQVKNTFCLTRDRYAFISQHIGDMENLETLSHFERTLALYKKLFRIDPQGIAYDLHPEYLATKYARTLLGPKIAVQHHFAHLASCLAENEESEPAIGLIFDGLGYGSDGHFWGGEYLVGDCRSFVRRAHLQYVPMPGGDAAIRHPWRMALSYLYRLLGKDRVMNHLGLCAQDGSAEPVPAEHAGLILQQIDRNLNAPLTSSCGRLFDAVAVLLGFRGTVSYEGQAAISLEMMADEKEQGRYDFDTEGTGELKTLLLQRIFEGVLRDVKEEVPPPVVAAKFHNTLVEMSVDVCETIRREGGPNRVALSGGVFQNRLLSARMHTALQARGFKVLIHQRVPCNDGGLSLGQAVIAHFALQ